MLRIKDKRFRIMQIADVHADVLVSPDTLALISRALEICRPDLVVFTGDQIEGYDPFFSLPGGEVRIEKAIKKLLAPLEKSGTPFVFTFGNHDPVARGLDKKGQYDVYAASPMCANTPGRSDGDPATCRVSVYDETGGKAAFDIFLYDSNGSSADGGYDPVYPEQLGFFKKEREKSRDENGGTIPALVFQHIPPPEFYDALTRAKPFSKGAVPAYRTRDGEWYVLSDGAEGFLGESPASPDLNSGEFGVLRYDAGVLALAVGHDHKNSFVADKDGIKLIYTQNCGFDAYGPGLDRGVRLFDVDLADGVSVTTSTAVYRDLVGKRVSDPVKEYALTHIPTSRETVKKMIKYGALPALLAAGGAAALCLRAKRGTR